MSILSSKTDPLKAKFRDCRVEEAPAKKLRQYSEVEKKVEEYGVPKAK